MSAPRAEREADKTVKKEVAQPGKPARSRAASSKPSERKKKSIAGKSPGTRGKGSGGSGTKAKKKRPTSARAKT